LQNGDGMGIMGGCLNCHWRKSDVIDGIGPSMTVPNKELPMTRCCNMFYVHILLYSPYMIHWFTFCLINGGGSFKSTPTTADRHLFHRACISQRGS